MKKGDNTPKRELLTRFEAIAGGLRDGGYEQEAEALEGVCASLRASVPKHASIQEVVQRAMAAVVLGEVTLAGRLVDALTYVGRRYGVVLAMHPALLIVAAVGGQGNVDRDDPAKSAVLDSLLATLVEDPEPYQESLYTLAVLARQSGLDNTADYAVDLLNQIHQQGADTMATQAQAIEERALVRPETAPEDDLGWVVKVILTLASIALVAATAAKFAGGIKDIMEGLDEALSTMLGDG